MAKLIVISLKSIIPIYNIHNYLFNKKHIVELVEYQAKLLYMKGIISTAIILMHALIIVLQQTKSNCFLSLESFS